MAKVAVTGGLGFIGSHLVDRLISLGHEVLIIDKAVNPKNQNPNASIERICIVEDSKKLDSVFQGVDFVYHLAANADVRDGWLHPRLDLEQNVIGTTNVLEAMRKANVNKLAFSSTGSVYGNLQNIPFLEQGPASLQTSLYGASKISGEAFIQAYSEAGLIDSVIFRFVSVLGPRYSHGHVIDFYNQLLENPNELRILGNGYQRKSYMHVEDCVNGLLSITPDKHCKVVNLGTNETCTVLESAKWICQELEIDPVIHTGNDNRGWIGDNPLILLDTSRAEHFGWHPKWKLQDAIRDTVRWLVDRESQR